MDFNTFINAAIEEDVGAGDYSSLCCIPKHAKGSAQIIAKQSGIVSGMAIAEKTIKRLSERPKIIVLKIDGQSIKINDVLMEIKASIRDILCFERLVLNLLQRLSGIATLTHQLNKKIQNSNAVLLDTRKTTPLLRQLEKEAVKHGGGHNHRMGLYDMIMLKDNHIDFAGGISQALIKAKDYIKLNKLHIPIEIETRNLNEVNEALKTKIPDRIMLDNFSIQNLKKAVQLIGNNCETEASGNINISNISQVANTGVQFISVGALTHSAKWLDLSLLATGKPAS